MGSEKSFLAVAIMDLSELVVQIGSSFFASANVKRE